VLPPVCRADYCHIQRAENVRDPVQSFNAYISSERACGVQPDALPYILHARNEVPFRGTVVLVHGLGGNPVHLRQIADHLQSQGYNVVAPILEGHGADDARLTTATLEKWQKDVKYAGSIAQKLGQPVFIGGHSTGGLLAALEASESKGKYAAIF
jgi:alpha-beta hydrolase superfamily lysophospholipase